MIVSLIVAMDEAGGIGLQGQLPWRLGSDLKRFKHITMGHHLIMGRKTYESIGRSLPGRTTIILTRNLVYWAPGCLLAHSIESALKLAETREELEAFIIGGGEIFLSALEFADRLYLTQVHTVAECDVFFPHLDLDNWVEVERAYTPANERNQYPFTFRVLERSIKDQV